MEPRSKNLKRIGILIVVLGALFYCYEYFLRVAPSVMKDDLVHHFGLTAAAFGTLSAFYFYAYTPLQLVVGVLIDRYRVRYVLVSAVILCVAGALLFALGPNYYWAAFGRFLQGFGSAFAFVGAVKLVAIWLPEERFALAAGTISFAGFFGAGMSQIVLTELNERFNWQTTIICLAILGLVLAGLIALTLRIKNTKKHVSLHYRKSNSLKLSIRALWHAIQKPAIWLAGLYAGLMFLPTSVFAALWGIPYLETADHYSPTHAATAVSAIFVGWAVGSIITGWLADLLKTRAWIMRVGALAACLLSILLIYDNYMPFLLVTALFFVFGVCSGAEPLSFVIAKDNVPSAREVGGAIAFVNTLTMLGGLLFQRGVGEIMDAQGGMHIINGTPTYSLEQYQIALVVVPVSLALAFVVALFIKDKKIPTKLERLQKSTK